MLSIRLSPWAGAPCLRDQPRVQPGGRSHHRRRRYQRSRRGRLSSRRPPLIPRLVATGIHVHQGDFGPVNLVAEHCPRGALIWLSATGRCRGGSGAPRDGPAFHPGGVYPGHRRWSQQWSYCALCCRSSVRPPSSLPRSESLHRFVRGRRFGKRRKDNRGVPREQVKFRSNIKGKTMKSFLFKLTCITLLACLQAMPSRAEEIKAGDLVISQAWSRATPRGPRLPAAISPSRTRELRRIG